MPPELIALGHCNWIASVYYRAVQTGVVFGVFSAAQDKQRTYEECIASSWSPVPPKEDLYYLVGDWDGDDRDNLAVRRGKRLS